MRIGAIAHALERVLGDRQRHEALMQALPASDAATYRGEGPSPSLRIYVASKAGQHALIDDRSSLRADQQQRLEVVEAEFIATSAEALAGLPPSPNPRIGCASECKGEMLHLLAADNAQRSRMDYVAFLDDDIEVSLSDLLKATEAAAQRRCVIFQLQLSHDSHAVWPLLRERRCGADGTAAGFPEAWSDLNFVEIMAPVIAQSELDAGLLGLLAPFKSGFGWDFYLLPVLKALYSDFRPGLYREACMRHCRPVQTGNNTVFSNGLTALEEEELIRAGLLIRLLDGSAELERAAFLQRLEDTWAQDRERLPSIASAMGSITERHWQARALEHETRSLKQQLGHRETQLDQMNKALAASRTEIERLVSDHRDEQIAMRAHVAHVDGRNCELQMNLQRAEQHHEQQQRELKQEIADYNRYVAELKASPTWRLGRLLLSPFSWLGAWRRRPSQNGETD